MNRELTREEAIELHRKMWQDMQAELGDEPNWCERLDFKRKWVEEHFPNEHVTSNCFLCEYAINVSEDRGDNRCDSCPIAWNSSLHPTCTPSIWSGIGTVIDYRFSPISVILSLPEREEKCHE